MSAMTQKTQRIYQAAAISCFLICCLTLFDIMTVLFFILASYFLYRFLAALINRQIERGLIELLPQNMQNILLNRSIFDFICDIWFVESIRFFQLLFRPLLFPVDPDNAIEALQDVHPESRGKFLVKGIVRIMPASFQTILLGRQRMINLAIADSGKEQQQQQPVERMIPRQRISEKSTQSQQLEQKPKLKRSESTKQIGNYHNSPEVEARSQYQIKPSTLAITKWDRLHLYRKGGQKKLATPNIMQTVHNYMEMIKKIIEIKNLSGEMQRISTGTIMKIMILFWILLFLQIKLNKRTRKTIFQTVYIVAGMFSVFGAIGTTGLLVYKHIKTDHRQAQIDHQ